MTWLTIDLVYEDVEIWQHVRRKFGGDVRLQTTSFSQDRFDYEKIVFFIDEFAQLRTALIELKHKLYGAEWCPPAEPLHPRDVVAISLNVTGI